MKQPLKKVFVLVMCICLSASAVFPAFSARAASAPAWTGAAGNLLRNCKTLFGSSISNLDYFSFELISFSGHSAPEIVVYAGSGTAGLSLRAIYGYSNGGYHKSKLTYQKRSRSVDCCNDDSYIYPMISVKTGKHLFLTTGYQADDSYLEYMVRKYDGYKINRFTFGYTKKGNRTVSAANSSVFDHVLFSDYGFSNYELPENYQQTAGYKKLMKHIRNYNSTYVLDGSVAYAFSKSFDTSELKEGRSYKSLVTASAVKAIVNKYLKKDQAVHASVAAPKLSSVSNSVKGVVLQWKRVSNAAGYYVYRKNGSSGWKKIASVTATAYLDKAVKSGGTYTYTVRAHNRKTSGYYHKGLSIKFLAAPSLRSVKSSAGGVVLNYNKVTGVSGYKIFRRTATGSWGLIGTSKSLSYTDFSTQSGIVYYYTVRAYSGKTLSGYYGGMKYVR